VERDIVETQNVQARRGRQRKAAAKPSAPARRTQEERSTETRGRLVEAAIRVLDESGYANLTISKIAQKAGLTNGAMQHHFASRGELLVAVLDALYPVLEIPIEQIASQNRPIPQRVNMIVDLFWQIYSRPEYLVIWDIAFGTRSDPALRSKLQAYQRDIAARLRKHLAKLFVDVGLSPPDADKIFDLVISYLRGLALQTVFGVDRRHANLDQIKALASEQIEKLRKK
jgi:AcrR family transcriptional regulator